MGRAPKPKTSETMVWSITVPTKVWATFKLACWHRGSMMQEMIELMMKAYVEETDELEIKNRRWGSPVLCNTDDAIERAEALGKPKNLKGLDVINS